MTNIYLVRHGETEFNVANRLQGVTDIPLNSTGIKKAECLAHSLRGEHLYIYSSPLKRAMQTARIIADGRSVEIDARLRERNYGDYEGINLSTKFRDRFGFGFPDIKGGESINGVIERADAFINSKIKVERGDDKNILVVAHGFILSCIANRLLNRRPTFENLMALRLGEYVIYNKNTNQITVVGGQHD